MFEDVALGIVLTTNVGCSFNLSAPGAFSLAKPDALSNSDVSALLLTKDSVVATPTAISLGLLVYFETIISCSEKRWKVPFWKMTPSPTFIWKALPITLNWELVASVTNSLLAIVTFPVLFKFTETVICPFEIAFAKSYVVLAELLPCVNTPPLEATIVADGRSSTLNPEPFALTFTDENTLVLSVVTTLPENPVPFSPTDTDIVSLLLTNTSDGTPVNTILEILVSAGYASSSIPASYAIAWLFPESPVLT